MTTRILGWVILCCIFTAAWWFGADWAERTYGVIALARPYLGDSAADVLRFAPPAVLNLFAAAILGLFGKGTSPMGKMGAVLWSGALPYFALAWLITLACGVNTVSGNQCGSVISQIHE